MFKKMTFTTDSQPWGNKYVPIDNDAFLDFM